MSDPFRYYIKNADSQYNEQLSFRFAASSRQEPTVIVTKDLKKYCNLIDVVLENYFKAKSAKENLLQYKKKAETTNLTRDEENKVINLKKIRMTSTHNVNTHMTKICELAEQLYEQCYDVTSKCEYSVKYDKEKKIWKFLKNNNFI